VEFSGRGGCETENDGDATVAYDRLADRWVIQQFSLSPTSRAPGSTWSACRLRDVQSDRRLVPVLVAGTGASGAHTPTGRPDGRRRPQVQGVGVRPPGKWGPCG
jgi:hypothetical protein